MIIRQESPVYFKITAVKMYALPRITIGESLFLLSLLKIFYWFNIKACLKKRTMFRRKNRKK
jgi:hypothetical protein